MFAMFASIMVVTSCSKDPQSPGYEFMPDMYRSPAYGTYSPNPVFEDGLTAQEFVDGTIPYNEDRAKAVNYFPYPYEDSFEGYEAAGANLKNPIPLNDQVLEDGKKLYINFCSQCHGPNGAGDGKIGQINVVLMPPAYNSDQLKNLPEGKIFHSITYGKGMMGAHKHQLTKLERWKLVHYVQSLQKSGEGTSSAKVEEKETEEPNS